MSLNPAYTQYGDLPLLQLLSVTGLRGVDFLMAWFASTRSTHGATPTRRSRRLVDAGDAFGYREVSVTSRWIARLARLRDL